MKSPGLGVTGLGPTAWAKTKPRHWGVVGGVPGSYATRLMTGQQGCRGMGMPPSRPMAHLMRLSLEVDKLHLGLGGNLKRLA
jgi:hypothetical protein